MASDVNRLLPGRDTFCVLNVRNAASVFKEAGVEISTAYRAGEARPVLRLALIVSILGMFGLSLASSLMISFQFGFNVA